MKLPDRLFTDEMIDYNMKMLIDDYIFYYNRNTKEFCICQDYIYVSGILGDKTKFHKKIKKFVKYVNLKLEEFGLDYVMNIECTEILRNIKPL